MKSAALQHLESLLQAKKLEKTITSSEHAPETAMVSTGVALLDEQLGGGWRRGEISEVWGVRSTGRTSVLVSTLVAATADGAVVALVDAVDRFDPASAAAAGLDLNRVLWVRGPAITVETARPTLIEQAVVQAVRAFDLIVRAGGFSVVALDLADVPSRYVCALPFATWLRIAHANEGRSTAGLLVGEAPMGRSARGISVSLEGTPIWNGESPQTRQFKGISSRFRVPGSGSRFVSASAPSASARPRRSSESEVGAPVPGSQFHVRGPLSSVLSSQSQACGPFSVRSGLQIRALKTTD